MIAAAALAAAGLFALPATGAFPVWLQTDARWAALQVPGELRGTVGQLGCAVTSAAMLLRGLGKTIGGRPADPRSLNGRIRSLDLEQMAAAAGLHSRRAALPIAKALARGPLIVEIRYRRPPELGGQPSHHFVLATQLDLRRRVIVHDPLRGRRALEAEQPLDQVLGAYEFY